MSDRLSVDDRLELHELNSRYADLIDRREWDGLPAVIADGAIFDIRTPDRSRPLEGLEPIKDYMAHEARHPAAHHITNIYVDASDAEVRLRTRLILIQHDGRAESGEYDDVVVRTDTGSRRCSRLPVHRPTGVSVAQGTPCDGARRARTAAGSTRIVRLDASCADWCATVGSPVFMRARTGGKRDASMIAPTVARAA